ncbi:hypothetical protein SAMN03159352_02133 [Pseudomonas sp. NFACC43]|nr:hypothetical protein SAMN03159442_01927 [Pseudomonas sp. NFACC47-1]SFX78914.1 hypothetical protein SAMN03159352_02133 [Pseudomonas sp. NFACC43]
MVKAIKLHDWFGHGPDRQHGRTARTPWGKRIQCVQADSCGIDDQ